MPLSDQIDQVFLGVGLPGCPGVSTAVIRDGKMLYSKGYGCAQLEYRVPITPETRFHVASVSKQFTAFAVLLLEDAGALRLDDKIHDHLSWLPELPHPITIRQLINHTSGIRDQWDLLTMAGWRLDDVITQNDIRTLVSSQTELNFVPQESLIYSNTGYTLLADIVTSASSQGFADFTQQEIFKPLGMVNTHFHDDHQRIVPGRAYSYERECGSESDWKTAVLNFANVGATGLFSTPNDLALWLDNFRTRTLGSGQIFQNLLEVPTLANGEPAMMYGAGYAGGLMISKYRGLKTIGHDGSDAGFRSSCQWFPDQNVGIVVVANYADCNVRQYHQQLADIVLESTFEQPPDQLTPQTDTVCCDPALMKTYTGAYHLKDIGLMTLSVQDNALSARLTGFGEFTIDPVSDKRFYAERLEGYIEFQRRSNNLSYTACIDSPYLNVSGSPIPNVLCDESDVEELTGTYFSPELRVFWDVRSRDNGLYVHHHRHGDIALVPACSEPDQGVQRFLGDKTFASLVDFAHDRGRLTMRVSSMRAKRVLFEKLNPNYGEIA